MGSEDQDAPNEGTNGEAAPEEQEQEQDETVTDSDEAAGAGAGDGDDDGGDGGDAPEEEEEEEEPVDPKPIIEEYCKPRCVKPLLQYEACVKRIEEDDAEHKHCTGQYFDYWACVDKCAAPKVFSKLK